MRWRPGIGYEEIAGWVPGGKQILVAREAIAEGKTSRRYELINLSDLSIERSASEAGLLGAFNRWSDPAWRADSVAARKHSSKRLMLSFDEWNVWYRTRRNRAERVKPGWPVAPEILEEIYTMDDALAFGGMCISLLNHADRVKCACLAQLVNVIAPIMTQTGGPAWRQTIFHPFAQMSHFGRGRVLKAEIDSPTYAASYFDPRGATDLYFPLPKVPYLKLAAVEDPATGAVTLFALNRHLEEPMSLDVALAGYGTPVLIEALQLRHDDLSATNTQEHPDRVSPTPLKQVTLAADRVKATLGPASWNMIRLGRSAA